MIGTPCLKLENDGVIDKQYRPVDVFLAEWAGDNLQRQAVKDAILAILEGGRHLAERLAWGILPGDPGEPAGENCDGDTQKRIDVGAHHMFVDLLVKGGVASILSEEANDPIKGDAKGKVAAVIDPLDGSANIGIGAPLGTIFSCLPAAENNADTFLTPGRNQLAAGYIAYGHTVDCGFSVGEGVMLATLCPADGRFYITRENVKLGEKTSALIFNASVHRHLYPAMQHYVNDCFAGTDGPRKRNFNMRWLGALAGEVNRILNRNGLFFYVNDKRKGYENGRLRLIYEANPVAFLCEQANGKATDGKQPILDRLPVHYHERCPLIFGCAQEVETVLEYLQKN